MEQRKILANYIMAPDGAMIPSMHRHDYRIYKTEDGRTCEIDGGRDYIRFSGEGTLMTVYEDDPFEVIRRFFCRADRGKNLDNPIKYTPLFAMSDEWLSALMDFLDDKDEYKKYYRMEIEYRKNLSCSDGDFLNELSVNPTHTKAIGGQSTD